MSNFTTWRSLVDGEEIGAIRVVSRPNDDDSTSVTDRSIGVTITPKNDFDLIGARISQNTVGVTRARIYDYEAGEYIQTVDISDKSSGDVFVFEVDIKQGQNYGIEVDDKTGSYDHGFLNDGTNYPYEGDEIDIVGRSDRGVNETDQNAGGVNDIGNPDGVLN